MLTTRFPLHRQRIAGLLATTLLALCACKQQTANAPAPFDISQLPQHVETVGVTTSTLNYAPWYIHKWGMEAPQTSNVGGGGPNVMPADSENKPGDGGESCCSNIPGVWQPGLRLTVRWLVDKKQDGKTGGYWYKANNVRLARYGEILGSVRAVFLPGDRVRIMVADGNRYGGNDVDNRPPDSDPYIAQGVPDEEWNRLYRHGGNTQ